MDMIRHAHVPTTKEEIRQKYEAFARRYDLAELIPELGLRNLRQKLLQRASGEVLQVAVGTGKNLRYYRRGCQLTAVDLSPAMLAITRRRAAKLGLRVSFGIMDAAGLAFPDQSFDTVVDTLRLCTFPDPVAALRDMATVCRANGPILLSGAWPRRPGAAGRLAGSVGRSAHQAPRLPLESRTA